jgi:hypothetical protein
LGFKHAKNIGLSIGQGIMDFILFSFLEDIRNFLTNYFSNTNIPTTDWKVIAGFIRLVGATSIGTILIIRLYHYLKKKKEKTIEIEKPTLTNNNENQSQQTISVTKKLGSPRITEGIQEYENRDELPKFKELITSATETVDMSGLSFTLMILQHSNVIKKALKKGRKFTFLILDKDSKEVEKYSQTFENAKDLKNHINSTLDILCELKKELKDKDNLIIKTYDSFQKYGIIIIDKDNENALIKVEEYNLVNPDTRRNKIAYKVDNPDFYESSWIEYNELFEKSKDYVC